jgi:5'-nucleotidase
MRLLVTNDDGIESEGLHVLAAMLVDAGHEPLVVAPDRDWSGASSALGRLHPDETIDVKRVQLPGRRDIDAYSINGPPALAVLSGHLGAFDVRVDAVVSGINAGSNTGRAILHSGTVGAVLTAQNFGLSGLAVSVQSGERWHWDTAASLACDVLRLLEEAPSRSALNLNAPARPRNQVEGIRWARLAPFGEVRTALETAGEGHFQFVLRETRSDVEFEPDTDQGLLRRGYASLTTLVGVVEAWPAEEGLSDEAVELPRDVLERITPGAPLHEVHRVPDAAGPAVQLRRPHLSAS